MNQCLFSDDRPLDEIIIPSKDIRKYHNDINFKFGDSDKSTLIVNSKMGLSRKIAELYDILSSTNDKILKNDLELYINFISESIRDFVNNDNNSYIYILYIWDQLDIESDDGWYNQNGYFLDFNDIKNVIDILIKSESHKNSLIYIDKVKLYNKNIDIDEDDGYIDDIVGTMYFDYGFIPYNIYNINFKELDRFFEKDCFYYKYINIPYPFKQNDIITSIAKKYNHSYRKIKTKFNIENEKFNDYSDTKICITTEDGIHEHINITDIEYYRENEENG